MGENSVTLRAAVFSLSSINLKGGGGAYKRPPSRARDNEMLHLWYQYIGQENIGRVLVGKCVFNLSYYRYCIRFRRRFSKIYEKENHVKIVSSIIKFVDIRIVYGCVLGLRQKYGYAL